MIKIKSITIEKFRGIKRLHYILDNENLVIHGPNGSGKSGVIDAIEFSLTGDISRLSGMGTAGVSTASHGPHVDFRDNPREAKTIIEIINKKTSNIFFVQRNVSSPSKPKIEPDNEEAQNILDFFKIHSEFCLSRREILKYIVTEPGKRAKEVQSLLKMGSIDKIRTVFKKLDNEITKISDERSSFFERAKTELLNHLGIVEINSVNILEKINIYRNILGLDNITVMNASTIFSIGLDDENKNAKRQVQKNSLIQRIGKVKAKIISTKEKSIIVETPGSNAETLDTSKEHSLTIDIQRICISIQEAIATLETKPESLSYIKKQDLYEAGLELIVDSLCPLCDSEFEITELKKHIQHKIDENQKLVSLKRVIEDGCKFLQNEILDIINDLNEIKRDAVILELHQENEKIIRALERIEADKKLLNEPFENINNVKKLVQSPYENINKSVLDSLEIILQKAEKIQDYSAEENAKKILIITDEKFANYNNAKLAKSVYSKKKELTNHLLRSYEETSEKSLVSLYEEVEREFSTFYGKINNDDEENFIAKLTLSKGGLDLGVDFYNRGVFPPNAFHSEGHQDGMGLCLYLALSKKIADKNFTLCLLDDVLMSVDANHRREFCHLLKSEFPNTQFIITTHDEVWKKQLVNEGVVNAKQVMHFRKWSVDNGPLVLDEEEELAEIERNIRDNNISNAASGLRHYLEYIMNELSIKLKAKLECNTSGSYDLGELLPAVISQYINYLKKAKQTAKSWGKNELISQVSSIESKLAQAHQNTQAEQWPINAAIHYNAWAQFTPNDFLPVKKAFDDLLSQFKCEQCNGWVYASPSRGKKEQMRCDCGSFMLNLNSKE